MSEKQTLSTWLRKKEVYRDSSVESPDTKSRQWRDDLLMEFDSSTSVPDQKTASREDRNYSPLESHHLLILLPVGLVLFALGWLFGSQTISLEKVAGVSPWVWAGSSFIGSLGFLVWRGQGISGRR